LTSSSHISDHLHASINKLNTLKHTAGAVSSVGTHAELRRQEVIEVIKMLSFRKEKTSVKPYRDDINVHHFSRANPPILPHSMT